MNLKARWEMFDAMPGKITYKKKMPVSDDRLYRETKAEDQLISDTTGWTIDEIKEIKNHGKEQSREAKLLCSRRKSGIIITVILLCILAPLAWLLGDYLSELHG